MLENISQVNYLAPRPPPLGDMSLEESVTIGLELISERAELLMKFEPYEQCHVQVRKAGDGTGNGERALSNCMDQAIGYWHTRFSAWLLRQISRFGQA